MNEETHLSGSTGKPAVLMPTPTAWPFVMAIGMASTFAGLLTDVSVSILGSVLAISGAVGWFRQVLPHEQHEPIPIRPEEPVRAIQPREVMRLPVVKEIQRAWLPLKVYPVSAGVKGGLAGGVAMAVLAMLYGLIFYRSVWYPINLLAGILYAPSATPPVEEMLHFHIGWFLFALAMHITMCLLVGLLYGTMLPLLNQRINWWWFAASQAAFGIVAGLVVKQQSRVWTAENLPLALRAGIEAPGLIEGREEKEDKR